MMPSHLLKLVCFFAVFLTLSQAQEDIVSYAKPGKWKKTYPKCGGSNQSPINIKTKGITKDPSKKMTFRDWDKVHPTVTDYFNKNDNRVWWRSNTMEAKVRLGCKTYQLAFSVFHWDSDGKKGSEHSIKGKFYSGESQYIFFNTKYADLKEAYDKEDGVAAIAFFYRENTTLAEDIPLIQGFKPSLRRLVNEDSFEVTRTGNTMTLKGALLNDMSGYRYKGSLTFPPCTKNVEWLVVKKPLDVTSALIKIVRAIKDSKGEPLSGNLRPTQALNDRQIFEV